MPKIRPFFALMPAADLQSRIVTKPAESYGVDEAKLIASENDYSYLHLVSPEPDSPYLRGAYQELIYKKIEENLNEFLEKGILVRDQLASIYIYKTAREGYTQTGIWALTSVDDYLSGHIKKHEHTVEWRERLLANYLEETGLDANPVLLTYPPEPVIDRMIEKYVTEVPQLDFDYADGSRHTVWPVRNLSDQQLLIDVFGQMNQVYIADGHHRAASMATSGLCSYFTTVYMNTREIRILEYNRLIKDLGPLSAEMFMEKVGLCFDIAVSEQAVKPARLHEVGMYFRKQWYHLQIKEGMFDPLNAVEVLDVHIIQHNILDPILGIKDPRTDARIRFVGGDAPVSLLQQQVDEGLAALAFTLFPVSAAQLIRVAECGEIMPPKSTWVEPKFLVGLLANYFK